MARTAKMIIVIVEFTGAVAHTCSCNAMCAAVGCVATVYHPINSSEGKTCLSGAKYYWSVLGKRCRSLHWSRRATRNPWSTVTASFSIASSNVLTISTSRPFCVPSRAPITVQLRYQRCSRSRHSLLTERERGICLEFYASQVLRDV